MGATYVVDCLTLKGECHLHMPLHPQVWERARKRAEALDVDGGALPGLYPYRWKVRTPRTIVYFYDWLGWNSQVAFFMYDERFSFYHAGIFDTATGVRVLDEMSHFLLNKIFRCELLGVRADYQIAHRERKTTRESHL